MSGGDGFRQLRSIGSGFECPPNANSPAVAGLFAFSHPCFGIKPQAVAPGSGVQKAARKPFRRLANIVSHPGVKQFTLLGGRLQAWGWGMPDIGVGGFRCRAGKFQT